MGYYTNYSLELKSKESNFNDEPENVKAIIADLQEFSEDAAYALNEYGHYGGEAKWYDHEDDFLSFSKKYPTVLFVLNGEGEESLDLWIKYFLNGKVQFAYAIVTYDEFDENKLVEKVAG